MNKSTGFTLIEVLIAVLVLAGGLLGLAGLQATSLRNNQSAYNRSQATQLAYDMADRMRSNVADAELLTGSAYLDAGVQIAGCTTITGCTPAQMAQNDLFEWNRDIDNALLASATGTIPDPGSTRIFTIAITWDDDRDGDVDAADPNFLTSFQI